MDSSRTLSPMDFIFVYMSPREGVGQFMNIDTIRNKLKRLPLRNTLEVLAQITSRVETLDSVDRRIEIAQTLFRPVYSDKAIKLIKSRSREVYYPVSTQIVVALASEALVYCDEGEYEVEDDFVYEIGDLILALAGTLSKVTYTRETLLLEMVRMDMWFRMHDFDRWCELTYRLVFEVLPTLHEDTDWVDYRSILEDSVGVSLELYVAVTVTMAMQGNGDSKTGHRFPLRFDDTALINKEDNKKIHDSLTQSIEEAKERAKNDIKDEGLWTFGAFYDKPLIRFSDDILLSVRGWFLMNKVTPIGFFNTIDLIQKANGASSKAYEKWSRLFGKASENLGRLMISEHVPDIREVKESDMPAIWGEGKYCDSVLISHDWMALDFVYRRVSRPTTTNGNISDFAKDLQRGVLEKLTQIDDVLSRALKVEGEPQGLIFSLVVIGAPFPVNGLLLSEVDRWVKDGNCSVIGVNKKTMAPMIMDLEEFWALLETAKHHDIEPSILLKAWQNSTLSVANFRNWLVTSEYEMAPFEGRRMYHQHSVRYLFGKDT